MNRRDAIRYRAIRGAILCGICVSLAPACSAHANSTVSQPEDATTSPEIAIWHGNEHAFGSPGHAQRWINVLGRILPTQELASLEFTLNGGSPRPLSVGPDTRRLAESGDFNVEIAVTDLVDGTNTVVISALDNATNSAVSTVLVHNVTGETWPLPYEIDWTSHPSHSGVVQIVDGQWNVTTSGIRTAQMGYDRVVAFGDHTWTNYEVRLDFVIHTNDLSILGDPVSIGPSVGFLLRWPGHTDWGSAYEGPWQPTIGWYPSGAAAWYAWRAHDEYLYLEGDQSLYAPDPKNTQLEFETSYSVRFMVKTPPGESLTEYYFKLWPSSGNEPEDWMIAGAEGPFDYPSGGVALVAHHADVTFGSIEVGPPSNPGTVIVLDDARPSGVSWEGDWPLSSATPGYYAAGYRHDGSAAKGLKRFEFRPTIGSPGEYNVYLWYTAHGNRAPNVPVDIHHKAGISTSLINQQTLGNQWVLLGRHPFLAGTNGAVVIRTDGTEGYYVIADAVRFARVGDLDTEPPSVPTGLVAVAESASAIRLQWEPATDNVAVVGYNIYRDDVNILSSEDTSCRDETVNPLTTYEYVVSAFDATGNESPPSLPASATTPAPVTHDRIRLSPGSLLNGMPLSSENNLVAVMPETSISGVLHIALSNDHAPGTPVAACWTPSWGDHATGWHTITSSVPVGDTALDVPLSLTSPADTGTYYIVLGSMQATGGASVASLTASELTPAWDDDNDLADLTAAELPQALAEGYARVAVLTATGLSTASVGCTYIVIDVTEPPPPGEIIVDNADTVAVTIHGEWSSSSASSQRWAQDYLHDGNAGKGSRHVDFRPWLPADGNYEIAVWHPAHANRADNAPVTIHHSNGETTVHVNQQIDGGKWVSVGSYSFTKGTNGFVSVGNAGTDGYVIADAVRFQWVGAPDEEPPSTPLDLVATPISGTEIALSWAPSTDNVAVAGYTVYRDGGLAATVASESFNDRILLPDTIYTYRLDAFDAGGNHSALSTSVTARTLNEIPDEIIVDNRDAYSVRIVGDWVPTGYHPDRWAEDYLHDGNTDKGAMLVEFRPMLPADGDYEVAVWYPAHPNRANNVPVTIHHRTGQAVAYVNQQVGGGQWVPVGRHAFDTGTNGFVLIGNADTGGYVTADAVRFRWLGEPDIEAPSVPEELTATPVSGTEIALAWTASTDNVAVAGYTVYRNDELVATVEAESFNDGGLLPGTLYTYQVAAFDTTGNSSALSTSVTARTLNEIPSEIIVDNRDEAFVRIVGDWTASGYHPDRWAADYLHDQNADKGGKRVEFRPSLPTNGAYDVSIWYPAHANRADHVPVTIYHDSGTNTVYINQQTDGGQWVSVGTYLFAVGTNGIVTIANTGTDGYVVADAVRFRRHAEAASSTLPRPASTANPPSGPDPEPARVAKAEQADPDGDGMPTWAERCAGTDPSDDRSVLRVTAAQPGPDHGVTITWLSASNRAYTVEVAPAVHGPFVPAATGLVATPPLNVFTDIIERSSTVFYRVSTSD